MLNKSMPISLTSSSMSLGFAISMKTIFFGIFSSNTFSNLALLIIACGAPVELITRSALSSFSSKLSKRIASPSSSSASLMAL